jgi:hypothetical protein
MAFTTAPGDCFILPFPSGEKRHLHIIITNRDPSTGFILCVPVCTMNGTQSRLRDETVILKQQDIPKFIKHESFVFYKKSLLILETDIENFLQTKEASQKGTVSQQVLYRVQQGLLRSRRTPEECKSFYNENQLYSEIDKTTIP